MRRNSLPLGTWVIAIAMFAVACGGGTDRSAAGVDAAPAAPSDGQEQHQDHALHGGHDGHGTAAAPSDDGGRSVTEATIAAMAAMDPEHLASLHHHAHDGNESDGPREGLNSVEPARLSIPAIGVEAAIGRAGIDGNGDMEVPEDFDDTAWFTPSVKPGRVGPSVITGHVDSRQGPAVFFDLKQLEQGDEIEVHGDDGEVVIFVVTGVEQHPKDDYPRERVHGATDGPELRLITCGGIFDRSVGHYDDNIIVFADRLAS